MILKVQQWSALFAYLTTHTSIHIEGVLHGSEQLCRWCRIRRYFGFVKYRYWSLLLHRILVYCVFIQTGWLLELAVGDTLSCRESEIRTAQVQTVAGWYQVVREGLPRTLVSSTTAWWLIRQCRRRCGAQFSVPEKQEIIIPFLARRLLTLRWSVEAENEMACAEERQLSYKYEYLRKRQEIKKAKTFYYFRFLTLEWLAVDIFSTQSDPVFVLHIFFCG